MNSISQSRQSMERPQLILIISIVWCQRSNLKWVEYINHFPMMILTQSQVEVGGQYSRICRNYTVSTHTFKQSRASVTLFMWTSRCAFGACSNRSLERNFSSHFRFLPYLEQIRTNKSDNRRTNNRIRLMMHGTQPHQKQYDTRKPGLGSVRVRSGWPTKSLRPAGRTNQEQHN